MMRATSRGSPFVALFFVHLFLLLFGCGAHAQSRDDADPATGRIALIEPSGQRGVLTVKQAKRLRPIDATEGMLIRRGYVMILRPSAKASVICGDGTRRELVAGPQGCPCRRPCSPEICGIRYGGSTLAATRGPDTSHSAFPVIITPRKTLLGNLRPEIRWSPATEAKADSRYRVSLFGEGMKLVWTREVVSESRLAYPETEPALEPGHVYKVVVTTGGLSSEQDQSPGLGFTTLTAEQARTLADDEMKVKQMGLPVPQTRFLTACLYAAREMYAEAIEQLENLAATMKEPALAATLGDLYSVIGLNREAGKKYLEALALNPADDLESRGMIERSLAQVYENFGMIGEARARLSESTRAYRRLGREGIVRILLNESRRLKSAGR